MSFQLKFTESGMDKSEVSPNAKKKKKGKRKRKLSEIRAEVDRREVETEALDIIKKCIHYIDYDIVKTDNGFKQVPLNNGELYCTYGHKTHPDKCIGLCHHYFTNNTEVISRLKKMKKMYKHLSFERMKI